MSRKLTFIVTDRGELPVDEWRGCETKWAAALADRIYGPFTYDELYMEIQATRYACKKLNNGEIWRWLLEALVMIYNDMQRNSRVYFKSRSEY